MTAQPIARALAISRCRKVLMAKKEVNPSTEPATDQKTTRVGSGKTLAVSRKKLSKLAERVGFEPTVRFKTDNALAGRPIRPLWHLSWER